MVKYILIAFMLSGCISLERDRAVHHEVECSDGKIIILDVHNDVKHIELKGQ